MKSYLKNFIKFPLFGVLILTVCFQFEVSNSQAATFEFSKNGPCDVRLVGEIVSGDADKLYSILDENAQSASTSEFANIASYWTLCLNSYGGSFSEALKIIEMRWTNFSHFSPTLLEPNSVCLSACALIFMAGQTNETGLNPMPARKMHPSSRLGFHAPTKKYPVYGKYDEAFVNSAFQQSAISIAQLLTVDKGGLIPRSLLQRALIVSGPENFLNIDSLAKIAAWNIELVDYKKPSEIRVGDLNQMCVNADNLSIWFDDSGWDILDKKGQNINNTVKFKETEFENSNFLVLPDSLANQNTIISGEGKVLNKKLEFPDLKYGGESMEFVYLPDSNTVVRAVLPGYADEASGYCIVNLKYGNDDNKDMVWTAGISYEKDDDPVPIITGVWGIRDLETSLTSLITDH